jgi:hypothetical protein
MSSQSSTQIKKIKRSSFPIANPMKCSHQRDCGCPECEKKRDSDEPVYDEKRFVVSDGYASMY